MTLKDDIEVIYKLENYYLGTGLPSDVFKKALSIIRRLEANQEWQPISTAPMDGRHILLYRPDIQFVGYFATAGWIINAPGLPKMEPLPTHWMPQPPMPKGA